MPSARLQAGRIQLSAQPWNVADAEAFETKSAGKAFEAAQETIEISLPLGRDAPEWNEFSPALYRLQVTLTTDDKSCADLREVDFGLRQFSTEGSQFVINGQKVLLRGKHDACVFPLTGYAPMDVESWTRILRIAKDWGINHYRFHSWCPPQAAFAAADIVGIYLQPELPFWGSLSAPPPGSEVDVELRHADGNAAARTDYILMEGRNIMKAYANHASFVMFALGNELSGDRKAMRAMIEEIRKVDDRPLCAEGSNNFLWAPSLAPGDDFWTTNQTGGHYKAGCYFPDGRDKAVRGSFPAHTKGHVNNRHPSSNFDYHKAIEDVPVPVIGHEIGQYQVYPNFDEIVKYTGVLAPRNFEIYRERLTEAGMLDQWRDFFHASGALSLICYREEIETAMRTPGIGGFQLLDLQDFPGQGTALVGMLDAFMDSKGLITPQRWREFCGPRVPLLRMKKYDWTCSENFQAKVEFSNFGPKALHQVELKWRLLDDSGKCHRSGSLNPVDLPQGQLTEVGEISFPLRSFNQATSLTLIIGTEDGQARNRYRIWVYPDEAPLGIPDGLMVTRSFDERVERALAAGRNVFLCVDSQSLPQSIPGAFQPDFWCYPMFKKYDPPGTLGLLIDDKHPALASFPTSKHSDWQWFPIVRHGCAMILDEAPDGFRPIIQVIDNFERNHKLALAFEAKVGDGRLFVCSGAIFNQPQSPASRQLLSSILAYLGSDKFEPNQLLSLEVVSRILDRAVPVSVNFN